MYIYYIFSFIIFFCFVQADAKSKKSSNQSGLSDLKMKAGDEKGNDLKALKAEVLIATQEERAVQQARKLLKKYKGTALEADLQLRLAEMHMRRSKTDRFLEVHRNSEEIVNFAPKLVKNATSLQQIKKAVEIYDYIESRFPNFEKLDQVLINNAFANQQIGNEAKAEKKFVKMVKEYSSSEFLPDAHLALGELKFRQRNFKLALEHFESIRRYPDSAVYPYGIYKAAWTQYNLRDVEMAIKNLEDVIQYGRFVKDQGIDARLDLRKEALFDLALFYEDFRPSKKAFSYFKEQSRELDVSPVILRLTELYKRHSRFADTKIVLTEMIKQVPTSTHIPDAYSELMDVSEKMKKRKDVISFLNDLRSVCAVNGKWAKAQEQKINSQAEVKIKPEKACRDLFDRMALGYANKWLRAWQVDDKQVELAELAENAFAIYLQDDPKTEESFKARFVYAEVLFKRNKYRQASENYVLVGQNTKDKKIGSEARYYALIALEKSVGDKWSDKDENTFQTLARDYLSKDTKPKYALEIEFKVAFIAYEKGHYDKAAPVFLRLGTQYAKEEKGIRSQDLYLDILNIKKDFTSLRSHSKILKNKSTGERLKKLTKIYEESYFFIVQQIEEAGDLSKAIEEYEKFSKENQTSELSQKALWNITQLYFKMGDLMAGARSAVAYFEKYSDKKEGHEALLKAAQTYEALGQLNEAADVLVKLSKIDSSNKNKWLALAADFYLLSSVPSKAKIYFEMLRKSNDAKLKLHALEQLELLARQDNSVKEREQLLNEIIAQGQQPQVSMASLYFVEKVYAENKFVEAFGLAKNLLSQEKHGASKVALARARFVQAKIIGEEFKQQSVNSKIERIQTVLTIKTEKLGKAQAAYQSAAKYGEPTTSVLALHELAKCYLQYSDALRLMPIPKGLPEEETQAFKAEMEKLAIPMEEKGIETLVEAYNLTKGLSLSDEIIGNLQDDMKKLNQPVATIATGVKIRNAAVYLPDYAELQTSKSEIHAKSTFGKCPSNSTSWRGENLKNIFEHANNCIRSGTAAQVERIGNFLSQKHYQTPWGPYYLSVAAEIKKEYARGIWMVDLALKRDPKNAWVSYQKGRLHWLSGEYSTGLQAFRMAIENDSTFVDANIFLGQVYFSNGDYKQALKYFENAKSSQPSSLDAAIGLAEIGIAMGNEKLAIQLYEEVINMAPRKVSYKLRLAQLYESVNKDYSSALSIYKRIRGLSDGSQTATDIPTDLNDRIQRLEARLAERSREQVEVVNRETSSTEAINKKMVKK